MNPASQAAVDRELAKQVAVRGSSRQAPVAGRPPAVIGAHGNARSARRLRCRDSFSRGHRRGSIPKRTDRDVNRPDLDAVNQNDRSASSSPPLNERNGRKKPIEENAAAGPRASRAAACRSARADEHEHDACGGRRELLVHLDRASPCACAAITLRASRVHVHRDTGCRATGAGRPSVRDRRYHSPDPVRDDARRARAPRGRPVTPSATATTCHVTVQ